VGGKGRGVRGIGPIHNFHKGFQKCAEGVVETKQGNNEKKPKGSMMFWMRNCETSERLYLGAGRRSYFCPNEREL
jgi:hypothetical protein